MEANTSPVPAWAVPEHLWLYSTLFPSSRLMKSDIISPCVMPVITIFFAPSFLRRSAIYSSSESSNFLLLYGTSASIHASVRFGVSIVDSGISFLSSRQSSVSIVAYLSPLSPITGSIIIEVSSSANRFIKSVISSTCLTEPKKPVYIPSNDSPSLSHFI